MILRNKIEKKCQICGRDDVFELLEIPYTCNEGVEIQKINQCQYCGFVSATYETKNLTEIENQLDDKTIFLAKICFAFLNRYLNDENIIIDINNATDYLLNEFSKSNQTCLGFKVCNEEDYRLLKCSIKDPKKTILIVSDYLEHQENPTLFVDFLRDNFIDKVYIQIPIYDYSTHRDLFGYFIKNHFSYFNKELICNIMNSIGYKLIDDYIEEGHNFIMPMVFPSYVSIWNYVGVKGTIKKNRQVNLIDMYIEECKKEINRINIILSKLDNNIPIAIWGTSNYAKKLLAMTDLKYKNIQFFYDNNESKQGTYFYKRKIKKFDINDVKNKKIEMILIASNTIYKLIMKQLELYNIRDRIIVV